jgi:hypothetical protein
MTHMIDGSLKAHPEPRSQRRPWKHLSADALEQYILELRCVTGKGGHFNEQDWHLLDRMRRRLIRLRKETVAI